MAKQKKIINILKGNQNNLIMSDKSDDQKSKPTPEQMRIAQILDKRLADSIITMKLQQIMDATERSADEVSVALHDSDYDVNRAVDLLMEGISETDWCTSEKKKKKLQELKEKKEETTEQTGSEDTSKTTKTPPFKGRNDDGRRSGRGRGTTIAERRSQGVGEEQQSIRGRGSRGRGRHPQRGPRGTMIFERSNAQQEKHDPPGHLRPAAVVRNQWERPLIRNAEEDWDADEFTGSLSQTQIFTSSIKPALTQSEAIPEEANPAKDAPDDIAPLTLTQTVLSPTSPLTQSYKSPNISPTQANPPNKCNPQSVQRSSVPIPRPSPPNPARSDYIYRPVTFSLKSNHSTREEKRPIPTKIPTSAVEMPAEMKPLSILDIQFGAMDLGPSELEDSCSDNKISTSISATTMIPPSNVPSCGTFNTLNTKNSISSNSFPTNSIHSNSGLLSNIGISTSMSSGSHLMTPTSIPSPVNISQHVIPQSNVATGSAINSHFIPPNTMSSSVPLNHLMASTNLNPANNHLMGPSGMPTVQNNGQTQNSRYLSSSQPFNTLPYSFISPPSGSSSHHYEPPTTETNTSVPPPHMSQPPHLSQLKQTGVPKGAIVANIPHGSLVGNQYIVGQGNMSYYPPHPFYYYEEIPNMVNNQQRLAHHLNTGYDVPYQPSTQSTRDGVHYNV